jgi:putative ABC transport system permease protein
LDFEEMSLPIQYNIRNVFVRWRATIATILGVALVVAVYILVQSLAAGLEKSSRNTGDERNVMIVRQGSTAESSSQVTLEQYRLLRDIPEIARDQKGQPLLSADVVVLVNVARRNNEGESHVLIRGISPRGIELRPQVSLVEGRWFTPGLREIVVSKRLAARFANFDLGAPISIGTRKLAVVGITEGGNSAFDSELWMDADECRSLFDRNMYSSVLARVAEGVSTNAIIQRIESNKQLPLRVLPETMYYAAQTMTAMPIKILGNFLATMMSIGAIFAAMNTMYASVGARTREIGTLRVLGYRRRAVLLTFIIEGTLLALIGGVLGCLLSLPMHARSAAFISFESWSEMMFQFRITPKLMAEGLIFALIVGVVGSLLPAIRAARLPVITALKAV